MNVLERYIHRTESDDRVVIFGMLGIGLFLGFGLGALAMFFLH